MSSSLKLYCYFLQLFVLALSSYKVFFSYPTLVQHRRSFLTPLLAYICSFWTTSGAKWMYAINKSSGWGSAPAWLLVNGTLLWRQITLWLSFMKGDTVGVHKYSCRKQR